jgi:hypothetical protein
MLSLDLILVYTIRLLLKHGYVHVFGHVTRISFLFQFILPTDYSNTRLICTNPSILLATGVLTIMMSVNVLISNIYQNKYAYHI